MEKAAPAVKVVIGSTYLRGSGISGLPQLVGTVYINNTELRVTAPADAVGDSLSWLKHCRVRTRVRRSHLGSPSEVDVDPDIKEVVLRAMRAELEKDQSDEGSSDEDGPAPYYHVLVHTTKEPKIEAKFDLRRDELGQRILEPYRDLRPIVLGGRTIPSNELVRIAIFKSERSSDRFHDFAKSNARSGAREWYFAEADVKDITDELISTPSIATVPQNADAIELLGTRFHLVARQLRVRHSTRPTLDIDDEYDVQDLMHGLLWLFFDDVREEVWIPQYAGKASRMDFWLPTEQIVIETKKTRIGLGAKELGDQLLIDIARYKTFQSCKRLICFVYDPDERIGNPRGLERDLSSKEADFEVATIIAPRKS